MNLKPALWAAAISLVIVGCAPQSETGSNTSPAPTTEDKAPEATTEADSGATTVAFADVQAILNKRCVTCHGDQSPPEDLSLTSYEGLMKGTHHGPIVKAGNPADSQIIGVMRGAEGHKKMPPTGEPVSEEEIKKVEAWIEAGANNS